MPDTPLTITPPSVPFTVTPTGSSQSYNLTFDQRLRAAVTEQLPNAASEIPVTPNPDIGLAAETLQAALEEIKQEAGLDMSRLDLAP